MDIMEEISGGYDKQLRVVSDAIHDIKENDMTEGLFQAYRKREDFFSLLIHDIKSSLIPIVCYSRKLDTSKINYRKNTDEYIRKIKITSEELLHTVEHIIKCLKEKNNILSFSQEDIDLKNIVISIVDHFTPQIEENGIRITINGVEAERWNEIESLPMKADCYQIKIMAENLLNNAIKYARSAINIRLDRFDSQIVFKVTDDGPGIPENLHSKIFDEYYQVSGSKKGTGLGLYIVKRIIENHKGKIIVSPCNGKGICFEVILPCYQ